MEVPSTAAAPDFTAVGYAKAATRGDLDASRGAANEAAEHVGAGEYVGCASRGEDAMTPRCNDIFEGAIEVADLVERAMKGDLHGRGEFDQSTGARGVHSAVRVQYAEDDTGRSEAMNVLQLGADGREVGCGVHETIGVRAQQNMDRQSTAIDGLLNKLMAGCETTDIEHGTELDAVRAAGLGRQRGFEGLGA
jgi:hypothetical protein